MSAREQNRARFPTIAVVVDVFREIFGADQVVVLSAQEGDSCIGDPSLLSIPEDVA